VQNRSFQYSGGFAGQINDELERHITERTAELQASNRELEAFSYSVSHDLRAPLRAIDGFSRILLEEHGRQLPAETHHYLEVIRQNATRMGDLVDDLLAFSRLGRQPIAVQRLAPAELARQALEDLRGEQAGRRVQVTIGELPPCEGDPLLLRQVFANLLPNVLKYTRRREVAYIEVGATTVGDPRQRNVNPYWAKLGTQHRQSVTSKIMVWALICAMPASCSAFSSG
jgi:signal transduction histidine kinase